MSSQLTWTSVLPGIMLIVERIAAAIGPPTAEDLAAARAEAERLLPVPGEAEAALEYLRQLAPAAAPAPKDPEP